MPLLGPQGIFKPAILAEMPLSIMTKAVVEGEARPYDDALGADGFLRYRYRGMDPRHRDNVGLRLVMQRGVPLVYLFGVTPGRYLPVWPVFIVRDLPEELAFSVAVDAPYMPVLSDPRPALASLEARRAYVTVMAQRRVHQQSSRERVLEAYRTQCAICRLRHEELLEAAHILPDGHPRGEPIVPNGLALCKLHHAAFDRHILGITPELRVEVRLDILREADGPMLRSARGQRPSLAVLYQVGVGMGRAHERRVGLTRRIEVVRGAALTGQETVVLAPPDRRADAGADHGVQDSRHPSRLLPSEPSRSLPSISARW